MSPDNSTNPPNALIAKPLLKAAAMSLTLDVERLQRHLAETVIQLRMLAGTERYSVSYRVHCETLANDMLTLSEALPGLLTPASPGPSDSERLTRDDVAWESKDPGYWRKLVMMILPPSKDVAPDSTPTDRQRLDWLEKNAMREDDEDAGGVRVERYTGTPPLFKDRAFRLRVWGEAPLDNEGGFDYWRRTYRQSDHPDLRAAIDAARQSFLGEPT